jgi:hypothetical protein
MASDVLFTIIGLAVLAVVVLALLAAVIFFLVFRRQPAEAPRQELDLAINVSSLPTEGPPPEGLQLECYGIQVRLAVLVLAPVGRAGTIPEPDKLINVVDQLIPGLVDIVSVHQPVVRFWPQQLSSQGFANSFFHKVSLPGDRGKGTPWCSIAGKFSAADQQYLAGVVCCAPESNGLSAIPVQHDGQWNDILRIRR